ncbi:MAG: DUF5682 family protein [Candidatus Thiodiazotropha sp.]
MDDLPHLESLRESLIQEDSGLYFAPIRHHSPACAWAVGELIREIRPRQILIEAPADLQKHIKLIVDKNTVPPVALAAFVDQKEHPRLATYYPFCAHSPEYVALIEGHKLRAKLQFIDLPSANKAMISTPSSDENLVVDSEEHFNTGDFVTAMCKKIGCRNGYELWDHLFESRLGQENWRDFFADVGAYCASLRDATPKQEIELNGDQVREDHMNHAILDALKKQGPILVITGGFHTNALINRKKIKKRAKKTSTVPQANSYLIRYGFEALDALSGYGAGLPQPGYYDYLWLRAKDANGAPQWRETALDLISRFSHKLREEGHTISVPAQVEVLRVAEALAAMRGRQGAGRHDLIDAVRTALVKGEVGTREIWTERLLDFLRGNAIGDIPSSAGSPPIVDDARSRAQSMRIDVSDGSRRQRKLDIRRKPSHLSVSHFFHAMSLLESGFSDRLAGPDFVLGVNTERLFEEWSYAWSPMVEGRLISVATLGDSIDSACIGVLKKHKSELREAGKSRDIVSLTNVFIQGLLAGLGDKLHGFLKDLTADINAHGEFCSVAQTLRRLHTITNASGPLQISQGLPLDEVRQAAYQRLIYLCDDLPKTPEETIQEHIESLRIIMELLRSPGAQVFDRSQFDDAVNRVADAKPPPAILGSVLAIAFAAEVRTTKDICRALAGSFYGSSDNSVDRIGILRGLLYTTPEIIWRNREVLVQIDELLCDLSEDEFLELLPHLRLAFTELNPRETDRVANLLANMHGGKAFEFLDSQHGLSQGDLQLGIEIERKLRKSLQSDGLEAWLEEGA